MKYENMPASCQGVAIKDLHIRKETEIISSPLPDGNYIVNPSPDTISLAPEIKFYYCNDNREQLEALREYMEKRD
ncbi:MAG: hypothetical protein R2788_21820 [Saprospiraceae bacterium]